MSSMYGHTPRNTEEQLHSQLQQLRVSLQETASQQQRLVGNLTAQGQKQDMRLQECECQKLMSFAMCGWMKWLVNGHESLHLNKTSSTKGFIGLSPSFIGERITSVDDSKVWTFHQNDRLLKFD